MGNLFNVDAATGDLTTVGSITSTSTTSGFLLPKLTTTQRDAIPTPATGLEVFNITTNQIEFYNGSSWVAVGGTTPAAGATGAVQFNTFGVFDADSVNFSWDNTDKQLGIGTNTPHASASVDITSITHGFLPPRMTSTQRDAIASPATGLQIYNITDNEPQVYDGSMWTGMGGGGGTVTSVDLTVPAFLSVSGNPITTSGTLAVTLSGTALPVLNGGTGTTTSTGTGSVVLSSSPTLVTPALGTPSAAVLTNATGLPLTTGVTGTLPVANGGTGSASLTAFNVLIGNGTSAVTPITPSTSGFVLTSNGTGANPAFKPSGIGNVISIGTSGTVTADAATGNTFSTTLTGALALNGPSNPIDGQRVTFRLIQGGTPFTVTFNTGAGNFRFSTDLPSFSASGANLTDYVAAVYNSGANRWDIVSVIQGF